MIVPGTDVSARNGERSDSFFEAGLAGGVMAILRGMDEASTFTAIDAAIAAGIGLIEIPISGEKGLAVFERAVAHFPDRPIGAGTILDPAMLRRVCDLGAAFTVAPDLNDDVVACALERGTPHLPGVATAGEVARAARSGTRWLKAFPASALSPSWITAMHGPFPGVPFVATGGVGMDNAVDFIRAGARAVSLGSSIVEMRPSELHACVRSIREALGA